MGTKIQRMFQLSLQFLVETFLVPINILGNALRNASRSSCVMPFIALKRFNQNLNMKMNFS
jgi:hypothetical protein